MVYLFLIEWASGLPYFDEGFYYMVIPFVVLDWFCIRLTRNMRFGKGIRKLNISLRVACVLGMLLLFLVPVGIIIDYLF